MSERSRSPQSTAKDEPAGTDSTRLVIWSFLIVLLIGGGMFGYIFRTPPKVPPATLPPLQAGLRVRPGMYTYEKGAATSSPPTVGLTVMRSAFADDSAIKGHLARELIRQSFLIAARDELNLRTRDQALGEPLPDEAGSRNPPLNLTIRFTADKPCKGKVTFFTGQSNAPSKVSELDFDLGETYSIMDLIPKAESFARAQWIDVLKKSGYTGKPHTKIPQGPVSLDIAERLQKLDPVSQFSAIRMIHEEIKKSGESPERLMALIRGYAQLGSLTEGWWTSTHKVYKARALLYAERLLRSLPPEQSAIAHAHRALARALTGFHQSALDELDRIKQKDELASVLWVTPITAFCQFDDETLSKRITTEGDPLPQYLQLLLVAYSDEPLKRLDIAQRVLERNPGCTRAIDAMTFGMPPIGIQAHASQLSFSNSTQLFQTQLPQIAGLPPDIKQLASRAASDFKEELQNRAHLIAALQRASQGAQDRGEPSWGALAQMVQEISFLDIWAIIRYQCDYLAVDANPIIAGAQPLLKTHPLADFIESHSQNMNEASDHWNSIFQFVDRTQFGVNHAPLINAMAYSGDQKRLAAATDFKPDVAVTQSDATFGDLVQAQKLPVADETRNAAAASLREISPHSPQSVIWIIYRDWPRAKDSATEWEQKYRDDPQVLGALATRYMNLHRYEDAERCLRRSLEIAPEQSTFASLAETQQRQGNDDGWLETMKESLEAPSIGLEHATTHTQLAYYHMRKQNWTLAEKHAMQAAQSGSAFGLLCAADFYELTGKMKLSEQFHQINSTRYDDHFDDWYLWCRRTETGDVKLARERVEALLHQLKQTQASEPKHNIGMIFMIDGNSAEALEMLDEALKFVPFPEHLAHAIALADEMGQTERRDEYFKQSHRLLGRTLPNALQFIQFFPAVIAAPDAPLDRKRLDWLIRNATHGPGTATVLFSVTGRLLLLHGHRDEAIEYLKLAATSNHRGNYDAVIATLMLRKLGIDPGPARYSEFDAETQKKIELIGLGYWQARNGLPDDAVTTFSRVLSKDPDYVDAYIGRAEAYHAKDDYDKAADDYTAALKLQPQNLGYLCLRGLTFECLERHQDAIRDYESALAINPLYSDANAKLAMLLSACTDEKYRDGKRALEHAKKLIGPATNQLHVAHQIVAAAYASVGDFERAIETEAIARKTADYIDQKWTDERMKLYQRHEAYQRKPKWWKQ